MTKVTQPVFNLDLPEYQRFKAESAEILLSNVSKVHAAKAESLFSPEIGLSEPKDPQAKMHDTAQKMLDALAKYELQKEREAHFGKARIIKEPSAKSDDERKELFAELYGSVREGPLSREMVAAIDDAPNAAAKVQGKPPPLPPVVGVKLRATTAEVIRVAGKYNGGGSKGEITEISQSAIKNAVEVLTNSPVELNSIVTCTYPETFPMDGRIVKAHFRSLKSAITRKYGRMPYFCKIEYQARNAPHFHIGLGINLAELGEVESLKRTRKYRRSTTYETVREHQDWLFATWKRIISNEKVSYQGNRLDWSGITSNDVEMMGKAYFEHNSGVSWEVMRDSNGAAKYFVKELASKKAHQSIIPDGFENPGRHFLYSIVPKPQVPKEGASVEDWEQYEAALVQYKIDREKYDMRFDDDDALFIPASEVEVRAALQESGWEFMPADDKPLFKRLWNAAPLLVVAFLKRGLEPVEGGLEALRNYAELRLRNWVDKDWLGGYWGSYEAAAAFARAKEIQASVRAWEKKKADIVKDNRWTFTFSQEPMGP